MLSLFTAYDVQQKLAASVQHKRKQLKLSRHALAEKSTVPASTIKKFETTAQISLRQFILLWQCVDSLDSLVDLCKESPDEPQSIDEVLKS
ncbi:MAG TPA: transcriptional regulator [Thiotrichaceae bacterium]|nr:transcriptional regulator [Thiotrichaceae bacterium]